MDKLNSNAGFRMTELEERLVSKDGSFVKLDTLNRLKTSSENIAERIRNGLHPVDFERALSLSQALAAAHEIVSSFPTRDPK